MGKARDEAGNIWETDAQGNPVRMIQPANPANSPFTDPRLAPQTVKAQNEAAASQYAPSAAQSDATIKAAEAANAQRLQDAKTQEAIANAQNAEAQAKIAGTGKTLDPSVRANAIQGYNYSRQLQQTVDDLNALFNAGPGKTKGLEGLKDYLPYTANQTFDTKANAARGIVGQTLGFTGGQLNTERESEKAVGPYLPQAGDRDAVILQKIKTLQDLADQGKAKAIQVLGGEPDENGNIHPVAPQQPQPQANLQQPQATLATGKTRDVIDPALKATGQKVGAMIASGVPDAQIRDFLQQSGIDPASTNINQALQFRHSPDFKRWQRANPGRAYPIGPEFYTKSVPMSEARTLTNQAAATDLGGSAMAGLLASANGISGGRLDNLVSDPQMARTGMDLLRANHPIASFAGDLAGQASLEGLAGTIPGAQGLLATRLGRRGADALYGAYSGSGESDDPGVGAVTGALSGLGLGMVGRGVQRGLGHAATGIQNAGLSYLDKQGIPLTVGRIARGANNDFGRAVGGLEDRIAGLPGMDAVIGDVRQQGDRAFNAAAFRQMPGHSGATGAAGLAEGQNLVNKAYSFLDNAKISVDPAFNADVSAIRATLPRNLGGGVGDRLAMIDNEVKNGQLTGRAWQDAIRGIRADRASLRGQPFSDQAIKALDDAEAALMGLASRGGPAGTAKKLADANALNTQFKTLAGALDNGPAQKAGEIFSAGRLDDVARTNARKFGGQTASLTGNRPFYDLTSAGKDVMPNLTPDAGTAGRLAVLRGLGTAGAALGGGLGAITGNDFQGGAEGGGMGLGGGLALGALLMSPYSKTGQKAIQRALLAERPRVVQKIGDYLINANPKLSGMFGSALGRDYFFQPELYGQQ